MNALAFCRFFARFRHAFAAAIAALTLFFAAQLSGLEVGTRFSELLPSDHPFIDTYRDFSESFGSANTISVAVVAREGDLYREEVLRGLEWVTEQVGSSVVSEEVNGRPNSSFLSGGGPLRRGIRAAASWFDGWIAGERGSAKTGVDHNTVQSLAHRTARDLRIDRRGALIGEVALVERGDGSLDLEAIRDGVRRNPSFLGVLVSPDETAAQVRASYIETRVDYAALFKHLQAMKQEAEARFPVRVHITGQPMLFGWTYAFAGELLLIFTLSVVITVALLLFYFRRFYGLFLPLVGAITNAIWGLGFAAWWGFHLDPLVLVVPMLITARAVSHSVQFVERFYEEFDTRGDREEACIHSMAELLAPGTLAILTDAAGLAVLTVTSIPLIHDLGILAAFWALSILPTEMLLNRLLILYLPVPHRGSRGLPAGIRPLVRLAVWATESDARARRVVIGFAALTAVAALAIPGLLVGERQRGSAILYPDAEYNVAAEEIGTRFFGVDELLLVADSDEAGRMLTVDVCETIEALQLALGAEGSGGSITFVDLLHQVSRLYHHNDPRWAICPQTHDEARSYAYLLEAVAPAAGYLNPYRVNDYQSLSIRVFYLDQSAETVRRAVATARGFAAANQIIGSTEVVVEAGVLQVRQRGEDGGWETQPVSTPEDRPGVLAVWEDPASGAAAELRREGWRGEPALFVRAEADAGWERVAEGRWSPDGARFRLAAGTVGLAAATNEVIARDHGLELLLAFSASFLLIALTYRSLVVGALLVASLATAAVATLSIQSLLGIGLQIHTLPVQAIGIGVGVDYAIYVVDRIRRERGRGLEIGAAIERAVSTTGVAVIFTASTLVAAIASWIPLSSLRFGAEMALLLCLLMGINAVTAVVLVPALMRWIPERVWMERS